MDQRSITHNWSLSVGAIAVAAVMALLVACGGDDPSGNEARDSEPANAGDGQSVPGTGGAGAPGTGAGVPVVVPGIGGPGVPGTGPGVPAGVPGITAECLALVQGFAGIGQLISGVSVDPQQVNAQLSAAARGNLPAQVKDDLAAVLATLAKPGGYSAVTAAEQTRLEQALTRLSTYAERSCAARP